MRRGVKLGIVATLTAGLVGTAGYGAYNIYNGLAGGGGFATEAAPVETGPPTAAEVKKTAADFLAAWAKGDTTAAGALTNHAAAASGDLSAYREQAHVARVRLTPGTAQGAVVPFKVVASLSYQGKSSTWTYSSALTVFRGETTHRPLVDWEPAVLHPKLTEGQSLETGEAASPPVVVVDRNGKELDADDYPSLASVLPQLRERYGAKLSGGKPGIETWVNGADGPGQTLHVITKGTAAKLPTTLDATLQKAAEQAVKRSSQSSVAAVRTGTGEILAFANNPASDNNNAFNAQVAPGSTFKVVTATALLEKGVSPGTPAPCPATANFDNGKMFHNVESSSDPRPPSSGTSRSPATPASSSSPATSTSPRSPRSPSATTASAGPGTSASRPGTAASPAARATR